MTLIEAYHHDRRAARAARAPSSRVLANTLMLGLLGCLWAGAFAARYGWL